jgi:hypothetical protein
MPTKKKGQYLDALLEVLAQRPKRKQKAPAVLAKWLAVEKRSDVRALVEALMERDPGYTSVGDFLLDDAAIGSRVAQEGDNADRDDIVCIGRSDGPDVFAVATPGTSTSSRVIRLLPRDDWKERRGGASLDEFLRSCVDEAHRRGEETELDAFLAAPAKEPKRTAANKRRAP